MKKQQLVLALGLVAGLGGASEAVLAQAGGWYAGASVGQASASTPEFEQPGGITASQKSRTGYKITAGYQFNPNLAVEGGYADLGSHRVTITGGQFDYKVNSWNLAAVGILPLSAQFSAFGKLGIARATAKNTGSDNTPTSWSEKHSTTTPLLGVGVKYDLSKSIALRGEYENYGKVGNTAGNNATGRSRVDMWSIGLDVKF